MEATVRALAVLEGWDNVQTAATLSPLHALVQTQVRRRLCLWTAMQSKMTGRMTCLHAGRIQP